MLSRVAGVPLVFDVHHHSLCDGGLEEAEALRAAVATWPKVAMPIRVPSRAWRILRTPLPPFFLCSSILPSPTALHKP